MSQGLLALLTSSQNALPSGRASANIHSACAQQTYYGGAEAADLFHVAYWFLQVRNRWTELSADEQQKITQLSYQHMKDGKQHRTLRHHTHCAAHYQQRCTVAPAYPLHEAGSSCSSQCGMAQLVSMLQLATPALLHTYSSTSSSPQTNALAIEQAVNQWVTLLPG